MEIVKVKDKRRIIKRALVALEEGGLLIYPTETCYGLGADSTNREAVRKLLEFKGSRGGKPISVAVADRKMAEKYVLINETADKLYRSFLPGPLTIVSKSRNRLVTELEAGKNTLGIRIPAYPLVRELVKRFGRPITATSANRSGKKTPYCLKDILKYTAKKHLGLVDLFLDAGPLPSCPPSTVIDTTLNEPRVLRQGEIEIKSTSKNTFVTRSEHETQAVARKIIKKYRHSLAKKTLLFALQGELGSGKTQFAKGVGSGLGIRDNIVSPTFVIVRQYSFGKKVFYHLDTWRLEEGKELLSLGFKKMLKKGNVVVIEWLQKIRPILEKLAKSPEVRLVWVDIKHLPGEQRKISYWVQS